MQDNILFILQGLGINSKIIHSYNGIFITIRVLSLGISKNCY